MTCTIRDIAQAAGVSASTVSLVLRGKENRISEETKLRVRQIAKQMLSHWLRKKPIPLD